MTTAELTPPTKDLTARKPRPRHLQLSDQDEHQDMDIFLAIVGELGFPEVPELLRDEQDGGVTRA